MRRYILPILLVSTAACAAEPEWYLFARDDGCTDMRIIVRMEKLSRVPVSPEDFAQMMRERGESVVVGLPPGFPPDLAGKVVQVQYGKRRSLTFVRDNFCRTAEHGER